MRLRTAEGVPYAMTIADRIGEHQARCLPHLLTLRMLVRDDAEVPFPWLARAEVTAATEAILAEARAASHEVRAATRGGPGTGIFLDVRLSRLAAAAADAIAAAGAGDFTRLRRHLNRFETFTSAIWAVQDASLSDSAVLGEPRYHGARDAASPVRDLSGRNLSEAPWDADARRDRAGHHHVDRPSSRTD